jgi:chromosomal replication initiator protein
VENIKTTHDNIWIKVKESLELELPPHAYSTWFEPISPIALNDTELVLEVPNQFFFEWIESHYHDTIESVVKEKFQNNYSVKYTIAPGGINGSKINSENDDTDQIPQRRRFKPPILGEHYTFATYIEGANNQFAKAAALSVSESPGEKNFNPLIVYGGVGLGKTHLLHAIGNSLLKKDERVNIICASSEKFMLDFISGIQKSKTIEFSRFYRQADVLLIDDIQFFQGKEQTQEQFFHTFNELYQSGKQIVLTADRYPGDMKGLDDRLLSRFNSGLAVDIQPPDFETRVAILLEKAEQNGLNLPYTLIEFMATHIKNSIRELESTIIRILAYSSLSNKEIDEKLVKKVVKERLGKRFLAEITLEDVIRRVSEVTSIAEKDIVGQSRKKELVEARQITAYLSREILGASLSSIGMCLGGRDHTTILHACKNIEEKMQSEKRMKHQVESIKSELSAATL